MNNPATPIQALVEDILAPHPDIRILRVRVNGSVAWLAGQFMELSFAGFPPRPYSIASAPHENILEFHIRNNHRSGANQYAVTMLKTGDALTLRGPFGKATLAQKDLVPTPPALVLIAGGMGISPIRALVADLLHRGHGGPVTLYWGGKSAADLYIADAFRALAAQNPAFRYIPVIEDEGDGLVHEAALKNEGDFTGKIIYLSGPPGMIGTILPVLLQHGATAEGIRGDDAKIAALHGGPGTGP